MTAEPIAAVVADIRAGRVTPPTLPPPPGLAERARIRQPVVDITAVYRDVLPRGTSTGIDLYDDFPTATSPWDDALLCFVNTHGNVIVMQVHSRAWEPAMRWDTDNQVDWDRCRWLVETVVWVGGQDSTGRPAATTGPVHLIQSAVYDDGAAGDIHWVALLGKQPGSVWDITLATLQAALNFLGCSNIEVAEPARPFPVRRRLREKKVQVQTIVVRPPGRRTTGGGVRPVDALDTPLTAVRGSFGHYGPQYNRGLLFGKYAGKFWRPAHARGAGDVDTPVKDYVLRPGNRS